MPKPAANDEKTVICWRFALVRMLAGAAATAQRVVTPGADGAPVVHASDAAYIRRQLWLNPRPLIVAQLEQIPAHHPFLHRNHYRIVGTDGLLCRGIMKWQKSIRILPILRSILPSTGMFITTAMIARTVRSSFHTISPAVRCAQN